MRASAHPPGVDRRRSAHRHWGARLALAAASLAVALVVAEVVAGRLAHLEPVTLVADPLLGFRGRPHLDIPWTREMEGGERRVRTNRGGYHDLERPLERTPGTARLAFLGDSFLEAYQVEIAGNFSQRTAALLSARGTPGGRPVEAVNFGVHGYGLGVHYLFVQERLVAWHPDAVVLALFLGNDLQDNYAPLASAAVPRFHMAAGELVYLPAPRGGPRVWLRDRVLARSALMRLVWARLIKSNQGALQLAREAGLVSTPSTAVVGRQDLDEMVAVADELVGRLAAQLSASGVDLLVFVIPDPIRVHHLVTAAGGTPSADPPAMQEEKAAIEGAVLGLLQRQGIRYLYPRDLFIERLRAGEEIYLNGFGHFTQAAHELSAELLAGALAQKKSW
ncbi:MAG: SGNH/GDSL hydrolase family protein [Gemmatimonadota bacterium]